MKITLLLSLVVSMSLYLAACGSSNNNPAPPAPPAPTPSPAYEAPISSNWVNTDSTSRIPSFDLSSIPAGMSDVTALIDCAGLLNGQPDESGGAGAGNINGVGFNQVELVITDSTSGTVTFGRLSHADHNLDDVCYTLNGEVYNYTIAGNTLTIVDPSYPQFPSTFTAQ